MSYTWHWYWPGKNIFCQSRLWQGRVIIWLVAIRLNDLSQLIMYTLGFMNPLPFMILALFNASFQAEKQSSLLSFKNEGSIFIGKIAIPFFWKSAIAWLKSISAGFSSILLENFPFWLEDNVLTKLVSWVQTRWKGLRTSISIVQLLLTIWSKMCSAVVVNVLISSNNVH